MRRSSAPTARIATSTSGSGSRGWWITGGVNKPEGAGESRSKVAISQWGSGAAPPDGTAKAAPIVGGALRKRQAAIHGALDSGDRRGSGLREAPGCLSVGRRFQIPVLRGKTSSRTVVREVQTLTESRGQVRGQVRRPAMPRFASSNWAGTRLCRAHENGSNSSSGGRFARPSRRIGRGRAGGNCFRGFRPCEGRGSRLPGA